jgi:hypothetical protein
MNLKKSAFNPARIPWFRRLISNRDPKSPWISFIIALLLTSFLYFFLVWILEIISHKLSNPASCFPNHCFCESIVPGTIKQYSNSVSSLGFCIVGFWIIGKQILVNVTDHYSKSDHSSFLAALYAISVIFIGIGSFIYHATLSFVGQFLDVASMNLLANFILLTHFRFRKEFSNKTFIFLYVILNLFTSYLIWYHPETRRILFLILILISILPILPFWGALFLKAYAYLYSAILILLIALVIWNLDLRGVVCSPNSLLQGHAIWHVLGSLVCLLLHFFYAQNKVSSKPTGIN